MIFGEAVLSSRERRGLTQAELAKRLGVSQQTVSRWESGLAVPSPQRVTAVEDELELERGTLLKAIGYLPEEESSGSPEDVRRILGRLAGLSDTELILVIDAAWQLYRDRQGLTIEGTDDTRRRSKS